MSLTAAILVIPWPKSYHSRWRSRNRWRRGWRREFGMLNHGTRMSNHGDARILKMKRKKYSEALVISLLTQVQRVCPLCSEPLFYQKTGALHRGYELAHIYPLNPTDEEVRTLQEEERLSDDINAPENIIPLCSVCHQKFDKPRTVEEYRKLAALKKSLTDRSDQELLWKRYPIEEELQQIVEEIYRAVDFPSDPELSYATKKVEEKADATLLRPTLRKLGNHVRDYYVLIRKRMSQIDLLRPEFSTMVSQQFKNYYLLQKGRGLSQQAIFENIVSWVRTKTSCRSVDAAEILVAFFVQNCEVFE